MCEKGKKNDFASKSDERKKVCPSGGNLRTINGKDGKYPLESSCQIWTIICKKTLRHYEFYEL